MKKFFVVLFFTVSANAADIYKFDPNHSTVSWSASHFGFSNPSGKFTDLEGSINLDEKNPQNSSVDVTIKIASLTTGIAKFDSHLKSSDFFNLEKYQTAKFVSTGVRVIGKDFAKVSGNLTICGITQSVVLDVKLNKIGIAMMSQKKTVGFSARTTIKRSRFGINFGLPGVSDEVKINIEAEGIIASDTPKVSRAEWKILPAKSKIEFVAKQNKSSISGSFRSFDGKINFDPTYLQNSDVEIAIDTSSIDISFADAAEMVKNATWLDIKNFPKATFKSNKFVIFGNAINKQYHSDGSLTLKGKTVPVILEFTLKEFGDKSAHVIGSAVLKRSNFGIGDSDPKKSNGIDDEVKVMIDIFAEK